MQSLNIEMKEKKSVEGEKVLGDSPVGVAERSGVSLAEATSFDRDSDDAGKPALQTNCRILVFKN